MAKRDANVITLGSGIPYIMEMPSTGSLPDVATICTEANRLGYVKGGAALTYTAEPYEEKDDLGYVSKIITTSEKVLLKLGLITWNGATLQKLIDRCKVDTATAGKRIVKIGGAGNAQGKEWVVCFHHVDKKDGDLYVLIKGNNTAGLTLTFAADAGTVIEPEFKALPQDNSGTLVQIIEDVSTAATGS